MSSADPIRSMPVLEPLSRATQQRLTPISLTRSDFLEIDVNSEGDAFIIEMVNLTECEKNILPNDSVETFEFDGDMFYKKESNYRYVSYAADNQWLSRIPERSQVGFSKHKLAATDFTVLVIHHVWPTKKLIFKSEEAQVLYIYLLRRFLMQTRSATIMADFKVTGAVPEMPDDFIDHPDLPMNPYQKVAFFASLHKEAFAYYMEQGTGKTAILVNRICYEGSRKRRGKTVGSLPTMYKALVLCPQQVRSNWQSEFRRFAVSPGKTVVLRGGNVGRTRCLCDAVRFEDDCDWSAAILSIDSVGSMWEALRRVKWDIVVIDESHLIKNYRTRRFKNVMKIDELHTKSKAILTGTPIANTLFDLWAQWEWLSKGLSGFSTYPNFKSFHGRWRNKTGDSSVRVLDQIVGIPLIQERLSRTAFLITKKEANLNLPDKVYDICETEMTKKQASIYKDMATKLVVEIENMLESGEANMQNMSADHVLTKLLRLAQITSGFVTTDTTYDLVGNKIGGGPVQINPDSNPKILETINMIKDDRANDPNSKTIIWCSFKEDIRALSEALHEAGVKHTGYHSEVRTEYRAKGASGAAEVINNVRDCTVFLGNPKSGGTGLNLLGYDMERSSEYETYVNHEIFFSCNWSALERSQGEDRPHRRGTRSNVRITDLLCPNTIDEQIRARVKAKIQVALSIQDVREIMMSVLHGYK